MTKRRFSSQDSEKHQWKPLDRILNLEHVQKQTPPNSRGPPRSLPDLIRQLASGNIDLAQLQKMQRRSVIQ